MTAKPKKTKKKDINIAFFKLYKRCVLREPISEEFVKLKKYITIKKNKLDTRPLKKSEIHNYFVPIALCSKCESVTDFEGRIECFERKKTKMRSVLRDNKINA